MACAHARAPLRAVAAALDPGLDPGARSRCSITAPDHRT